jgi:putative endonuclease
MPSTAEKGRWAEDKACEWLEQHNHTILDRNYRFMRSEVDIVAFEPNEIVFVEVRSVSKPLFGRPEETISEQKKKHLYLAAEAWLHERKMEGARIRFDVISIVGAFESTDPEITHFRNAFWM